MIKSILVALLVCAFVPLAGCATDQSKGPTYPVVGTIDQTKMEQAAFTARSTYAGLLNLAVEYANLPRCVNGGVRICSSQPVVNEMRRYSNVADTATKGAVDIARSPTKTSIALANAVTDANRAVEVFREAVAKINPKAKEVQ